MTGFRALTIVWVVLYHYGEVINKLAPGLRGFVSLTNSVGYRMDLLFILSGFILSHVYISAEQNFNFKAHARFLRARLIRLYPSYLLVTGALALAVLWVTSHGGQLNHPYSFQALPLRVVLVQSWPGFTWAARSWGYPLWFMSAVWFAYLFVFPCAWMLARRLRSSSWAALFWVFLPLAVWVTLARIPALSGCSSVLRAGCGFLSGSALCALYRNGSGLVAAAQRHLDKTVVFFVAASLLLSLLPSKLLQDSANALLVLAAPLLLAGLTARSSLTARLLSTRPFVWIGGMSYALYLTHDVLARFLHVGHLTDHFVNAPVVVRYLLLVSCFGLVLLSAVVMYSLVELPCAKALKNLSFRWPAPAAPPASAPAVLQAGPATKSSPLPLADA